MDRLTWRQAPAFVIAVGALAIVTSLGVAACSTTRAAEPEKTVKARPALAVAVSPVREGHIAQSLSYTGDVKAKAQVAVVPKVAGRIEEMGVDVGTEVKAGDVVAVLDHVALEAQVRQAEAALAAAKARLGAIDAGGRSEVVRQAEASLRAAEARLKQLKDGPTAEQRRAAQMNVEGAKVKLNAANVQKDGDCNPYKPEYLCKASQANAIAAAYGVDAAQAQYDALVAPPTEEMLTQAQAAVDAAREQLRLAQRPFTTQDRDAAQAGIAQAAAALDMAKLQLKEAYVTAPVAGVVSERLAGTGNMASPQTPIVTITSREVEIQVAVEEAKAGTVAAGQSVSLTVSAYPGQTFPAAVSSVAPTVDPRTRTVAVKIASHDLGGALKPGMFAQATIVAGERQGALLAPKAAVAQRDGNEVVFVARDGVANQRPVRLGVTDERNVEVLEGVASGEEVIVTQVADLVDGMAVSVERN